MIISSLTTPAGRKAVAAGVLVLALIGSHAWAYFNGREARDDEVKVENAKTEKQVAEAYRVQVNFGNLKAAEVETQRQESTAKLSEVLSNVHKVTDNRTCLSATAVRLLNNTSAPSAGLPPNTRRDAAESPLGTASDTDIAQWIAKAKEQYEGCAAKLNGIVDIVLKPP